ncbi:hypothetical protein IPF37_02820 [bacterium]|nr:MAG: hypothetical protein IPF37_02820 [bacterium]
MKRIIVLVSFLMFFSVQAQTNCEVEIIQTAEKLMCNTELVEKCDALLTQGLTTKQIVDSLIRANEKNAHVWELYTQEPIILTCLMVNVVVGVFCWWIFRKEKKEKEKMGFKDDPTAFVEH